jgi:hypothetical protein
MENMHDTSIFEFNIDEEGKSHLGTIAQWANINAIIGFAALGVSIISSVVAYIKINSMLNGAGSMAVTTSNFITLIITTAISLALNITLLTAAANIKKGVEQTDQGLFGEGIKKLNRYFKILGILLIVGLALLVLFFLVAIFLNFGRRY